MRRWILILAVCAAGLAQEPAAPQYVVASGISFDAVSREASSVSTLAVRILSLGGLPTYQLTTIETALAAGGSTAATLRAGMAQTVYQTSSRQVAVGVCSDIGVTKTGDTATVGTLSGCGWLSWDVGAMVTQGKAHVYIMPTVRIIAINGAQVKPSYALRVGTGF